MTHAGSNDDPLLIDSSAPAAGHSRQDVLTARNPSATSTKAIPSSR